MCITVFILFVVFNRVNAFPFQDRMIGYLPLFKFKSPASGRSSIVFPFYYNNIGHQYNLDPTYGENINLHKVVDGLDYEDRFTKQSKGHAKGHADRTFDIRSYGDNFSNYPDGNPSTLTHDRRIHNVDSNAHLKHAHSNFRHSEPHAHREYTSTSGVGHYRGEFTGPVAKLSQITELFPGDGYLYDKLVEYDDDIPLEANGGTFSSHHDVTNIENVELYHDVEPLEAKQSPDIKIAKEEFNKAPILNEFKINPYLIPAKVVDPSSKVLDKTVFHGKFKGQSCRNLPDGLYFVDEYSFAFCTSGERIIQQCAAGSANPLIERFSSGKYYDVNDFCSVNILT